MRRTMTRRWLAPVALGTACSLLASTPALAFPGGRVGGGGLGARFGSVGGGRYSPDDEGGGLGGRFGGKLEGQLGGAEGAGGGLRGELQQGGGLRGLLQGREGQGGTGGERQGGGLLGQRKQGAGEGQASDPSQRGSRGERSQNAGTTSEASPSSSARRSGSPPTQQTNTTSSGSDGSGNTYNTRGGGTVDTSKTTTGDTTDRSAEWTGAGGQSAEHSGSVTKDDGDFSYSGSSSNSAGASSNTTASGTYADGRVTSMNTSMNGKNAAGETGSHDGNWNRDGSTVSYYGNSQTSTGRQSAAAGTATKTDDGWVAHGAAENNQGAAAGTVVKDGNDVYARSVSTNGTTVNHNYTNCQGGDCTRTTVTTVPPPYYPASITQYSYYPSTYAYYSCPPGSMTVMSGMGGAAVYSCGVTPMVSTTIPLMAMMAMAHKKSQQSSAGAPPATAQVTSSPVVMYQVSSDTVVYSTSYSPQGLYWESVKNRSLWVPGAATGTTDVKRDIERAAEMSSPTANATVITYTIGGSLIYLTNQAPMPGVYSQRAGQLYAWMPGVTKPSTAQRDTITTAVTAHEKGGAKAIAAQVEKTQKQKPPPQG
jgi:hypothetical protein